MLFCVYNSTVKRLYQDQRTLLSRCGQLMVVSFLPLAYMYLNFIDLFTCI